MREVTVPAVVPQQVHPSPDSAATAGSPRRWRPAPLTELAPPRLEAVRSCAVATVDARGRVSDRSTIQALGWASGLRLEIRAVSGSILVCPSQDGLFTLTGQGYVRLPAAARHWCSLVPGERVLLVTEPQRDTLMIHTMPIVESLVTEAHARLMRGEAP